MSNQVLEHVPMAGKIGGEVVALATIGGTLLDKLPYVASAFAIFWHCLLMYDWAVKKWGRREGDNNNKQE